MSYRKWVIVDWANNPIHPNKEFGSFQEGWDFICETFPNEEDHEELFVVAITSDEVQS